MFHGLRALAALVSGLALITLVLVSGGARAAPESPLWGPELEVQVRYVDRFLKQVDWDASQARGNQLMPWLGPAASPGDPGQSVQARLS